MTDKDIDIPQLARKWAADCQGEGKLPAYGIAAQAAAEYILATTAESTMAGTAWVKETHYLAGAVTKNGTELIMLDMDDDLILVVNPDTADLINFDGYELTPNGKKYELREVGAPEQPEHPATLETLEDYENAPAATIVAQPGYSPLMKSHDGNWWRGGGERPNGVMAGTKRKVLRWGWGK